MLDIRTAAKALGAKQAGPNATFTSVTTDSRQIRAGDLFVALRGERFDGHAFVDTALSAGAVAAMVEEAEAITRAGAPSIPARANASLIVVRDTRQALGQLAGVWRSRFTMPLVAVTGSNGKTTVKDMLAAVLRAAAGDDAVLATSGNLNNDIGVPLMLLRLRDGHRYAVIEMGMNHLGEVSYLTRLAEPTVALINNAGVAHLGEVGSREAIARAKGEVYEGLAETGVAVINADDEFADFWRELNRDRTVIDFGVDRVAVVRAQYELSPAGSLVSVRTPNSEYVIRLHVPGLHNVRNALAAAAVGYALGITPTQISAGVACYRGTKARLQRRLGRGGVALIDDTYNANPDSVNAAIAVLAAAPGRRLLVLGDMGELGEEGLELHGEVGEEARRAGIDNLFTLGELSEVAAQRFGTGARHFRDIDALCSALDEFIRQDTTVLVKGSRFMRMERVVERFVNGEPEAAREVTSVLLMLTQWLAQDIRTFNVFGYLTLRAVLATLTALAISFVVGPFAIRKLTVYKIGQAVRDDGPQSHLVKAGTPTMGGALILVSITITTILWGDLTNRFIWVVIAVTLGFGAIGWVDDYRKVVHRNPKGLSAGSKYFWQSVMGLAAAGVLAYSGTPAQTEFIVPFFKQVTYPLGMIGFVILTYLVIVGTSNAVNLTDGLDGLAILPTVMVGSALGVFAYVAGHAVFSKYLGFPHIAGAGELTVFCAALAGAGLGFLWFNAYPAEVFMGDVGALALGAALGTVAVIVRQEIVLFIMGGVFVVETLSVMLQVASFKLTGRRIFRMAPLHHHYELKGWKENQVVVRFWIITMMLVLFGLSTLKLR